MSDTTRTRLRLGQVAERAGLSVGSARQFADAGIIGPAEFEQSGGEMYDEEAVERLALVKMMKPLGFSLQTMRATIDDWVLIGDAGADGARRNAALARLQATVDQARVRSRAIHTQLGGADALTEELATALERADEPDDVTSVIEAVDRIMLNLPDLAQPLPFDILDDRHW